jgi:hypothetical protein
MFNACRALVSIPQLDTNNASSISGVVGNCTNLTNLKLKNLKKACYLNACSILSKESLLYIINNATTGNSLTIKLHSYAYERLANDPDIVAALTNHPNISLAK